MAALLGFLCFLTGMKYRDGSSVCVKGKFNQKRETSWKYLQWHSQTAEKVTHSKGRLLDQAVILFSHSASVFMMGTSLKGKNLLTDRVANSFL